MNIGPDPDITETADSGLLAPLLREYLTGHLEAVRRQIGFAPTVEAVLGQDLVELSQFDPPLGGLFLARRGDESLGCIGLRPILVDGASCGEIKRLFVRPTARGLSLGRRLVNTAIARARRAGHGRVYLDTFSGMVEAQGLYDALGFRPTESYAPSSAPTAFLQHITYRVLDL